ncbi:obscurin isoform X3 [Lycorma delicatula]|uniref:obscurin isoform X3 n=1 Tax=Lycorma delicatula TaxID=130591 RepID=UPI003F5172F9
MSTFCRITGKSRGLPKPNYFPLLPPISPADAKRFCRITGKAYGLPTHHYIPVLVGRPKKSRNVVHCPVTQKSEGQGPHSFPHGKRHVVLADFRYVFPSLDESPEMTQLLANKSIESEDKYVYTVDERRCNLIFPAKLEAAVRDGDVRDVMLAKDADTVLLKLKRGGDVSIDVKDIDVSGMVLWEGEGPNEEVLKKRTKRKRASGTDLVRKIFEDKERAAELAEFEESEIKRVRVKHVKLTSAKPSEPIKQKWNNFQKEDLSGVAENKVNEISDAVLKKIDWNQVNNDSVSNSEILVDRLPDPISVPSEQVNLQFSFPGIIQQPSTVSENIVGFEPVAAVTPVTPLVSEPDPVIQKAVREINPQQLSKTANIDKIFTKSNKTLNTLPCIDEIPELINRIREGVSTTEEKEGVQIHGLKIDIATAQRFVAGQTFDTPQGPVFVPGLTVQTPAGETFLPGITVDTPDGPRLVPGQCVAVKDEKGSSKEYFVAGQSVMTREGEKFIQGQTLITSEGVKFVPGQTVISADSPRFVPGQILLGEGQDDSRFIPGQTESTPNGPMFVPGQTIVSSSGEVQFIAGQSVHSEKGWDFVPGKSVTSSSGEVQFLPGREIKTENGQMLVPGQYVRDKSGNSVFMPGVTVKKDGINAQFVPGATVDTLNGKQFVEGQILKSSSGTLTFVPGKSKISVDGQINFAAAQNVNEVVYREELSLGLLMNEQCVHGDEKSNAVYGHMVQTEKGVEFFPGIASGLPAGKVVPGKLLRGEEVRFIPGIIIDGNFVPGQIVMTDQGEQFVPGQVVETENGPKFVPGQVIDSITGPKFVPGQTVNTEDGPKFVPGQIVETRAGPTFIPGQIISTDEEGSRFVPGQVVDTVEGPRFVPGRVIETGDHVTFVPGQVVQTSEGLRFVAPDLQNSEEGECEFTVQSFQVTPEELNLLQLHIGTATHFTTGQAAVDSRMMRQLSQAGMAVGRQVPAEVPVVDVRTIPAMSAACELSDRLKLDPVSTVKLSQVMASIARFNCDLSVTESLTCSPEEISFLKELVTAVINSEDDADMYQAITEIIEKQLHSEEGNFVPSLDKLHSFIVTSSELNNLRRPSTLNVLREIIRNGSKENKSAVDKLCSVLKNNEETIATAFRHFSEGKPELIKAVVEKLSENVSVGESEKEALETLQRAIVNTVRESSERSVQQLLGDSEGAGLKKLILQAVGLARALGLTDVGNSLLQILSDQKSTEILSGDSTTISILRRLTVMRQLAENRPSFISALNQLQSDPELVRTDPLLRELVRESAALMVVPEEAPVLESSADIPSSLFHQPHSLAMEDYLVRTQKHGILLIIKDGLQMVVPREASRLILTGKVPYTVLDEKGIHYFAPLDVFSALRLPKMAKHNFSMYACKMEQDETEDGTLTPASSVSLEDLRRLSYPSVAPINGRSRVTAQEYNEDREIYVAKRDYFSEDENSLALRKGEKVIFLKVDRSDSSTAKKPRLDPELDLGDSDSSSLPLLDNTAAKHKMSIRPKRKHTDSRHRSDNTYEQRWLVQSIDEPTHQGWVPSSILSLHDESPEGPNDARFRREAVIRELVETEEEFGRDIQQVVDHYLKPLDNKSVPSIVRENKELIFGNLKQIAELHNSVLIEGVKYYANEPRMLGKTFIRLERDFDKHVAYCRDEPAAQEFLQENDAVHEYFEEVSQRLGDDKSLSEHLKLPIQRINDYQLLLKELVKYSTILGEDTTDLGKALELMLAVPHRANDNKFISNIEGFHGNIHKLGRLLRHDWFSVTDCEGKSKDRYLFLFKARILVCKVRRISEDRFVFLLKDIIRIPEVEIKDHKDSDRIFELHHKQPGFGSYPLTISAHKDRVKNAWLSEIREYASDILALAEHAADDLRLQSQPEDKKNLEPLTGIQLGPGTPGQELPIERISNEQNKENILPQILSKASKLKEVSKSKASEEIKQSKQSEEEIKVSDSNISVKRKEENEDKELPSEKKVKVEEETEDDNMDRFASSRKSVSSRRVEEFRSVSSTTSQEVYVETSSTHHQMSSSSSSSRSMKMVEESAAINGRTISQFREVTGDVDGFSSIQGITAGSKGADSFTTIEEVSSGTRGSVDYTSGKRDSKDFLSKEAILGSESVSVKKSSSSSGSKSAFSKTIGSNSLNLGERAIFECEVDENAKVMWLKDNKPLSFEGQSDRFTIVSSDSSHRLEISDVKESDVGSYTARAYNTATNSSSYCTAQLAIDKKVGEDMKLDGHAPFFIVHLKDTELLENTYLRFMIKVKGAPNPDVKFYKDDLLITSVHPRVSIVKENADKGFYELVIDDVQQEDAGKYKCVASNSHGEVECEAIVTVTDEKKLFEGLEESELLAPGETPHFTWLRDGQPFDPEERFKVLFKDEEDSLALVFQHVKPEDAGLYTCVASTSTGKISCSAELTVQGSINQLLKEPEKPKITTEIKKQEASIGGSAMLELKIEGFPKPQVQWTKDNQEIKADSRHKFLYEDDETMSLVIKGVTPDDAGEYHVKASNDLGDDSDVIHLTVKAPPKFKRKLSDFETMAGEDIHLTVDVEGIPKPTIQWYKDGLLIKKSDRVKMFEEASTEYTLLIEKSTLDDGGSYSVVATNELSQCSEFCHVQVHSPPQFIKGMIKTVETKEGDNASFQVKVQGDPKPSVKWLHNGKELKSDGKHIKISEDDQIHTLTLSGIARGDAGKYSCEISNKHGTNSDNADLNVRCSPQFRTKLSDMKANEGDTNIEFTVNVEAFPKPNVQWFHDEVEITEKVTEFTRVEEGDNYKLVIKEVTKELSGKYTCKVVNELGENTSSSTFTVYSKPKFRKGLKDVQVDEGASLTLEVEIEGVPEPTVKWYKNGQEVSGDAHIKISRDSKRVENYSLTFTLIKPEDGGEYEVRASNEMGTTVSQSTVTVHTKTSHIEDSELVEERQKKVPKKEEAEINERVNDETTKKAIDENDLRTKPKNAEDSEAFPQIISAEMESKSVFESLPSYFEVNAVANPRPDVKWYKDGKPIEPSKHVELIEDGDKYKLKIDAVEKDDGGNYKCVVSNRLGEKVQEANLIVMPVSELRCPKVKVPLKDLKIPKCESGELIAIFTADPEPEIKWTHDGNEVDADFIMSKDIKLIEDGLYECTFTLKIPAGKHEDTGTYKIEATNKYGFAESSARLDIILRPEILVFKDVTVTPHEDTELVAVIIANPKPKISWSFENKTVKDDDRHKIVNNDDKEIYKLELKSAGKADEGVYKLTASNSAGETSAEARINVHTEPPVFVKKIEDQTIREYAPAEFKVRANGVPKPEISWFKDGKKLKSGENGIIIETLIEGQVSSTLSIEHFNKNHEGSFTVKAVNMCGEDECSAKLKMAQIAPSFLKPLDRSTDVCETEPLELKAKIEGSPLPQVKWFKDGEELPGDDRIRLTTSPDGTIKLNIDSVKPADSGQYKLVVANPNGETTGICAVVVNPAPKKPAFIKELANIKGIEGEPLSLEAQIEGYPEPKVKWLKDGHPVRPSQSLSFVKTPGGQVGIEIDSVRPEDAGSYSLTISNKLGEETSKAQVEVSQKEKKPQFLLHLMPTSVVEGFPAKMEVKVTGYPKPELTWSLNGKPLVVDGKHIKIVPGPDGSECLVIDKTTPKDAGEYSVTAKNSQGEVTTKAPLNVTSKNRKDSPEEKPAFIKDLRDTYTDEGLPLSFSAPIIGNPIPDVEWEKDGVKLEPDDRIQITCDGNKVGLEINPSKLSDAGSFKCKLSNPLGQAESSAKGNVKKIYQPPKFTQRFTDIQQIPSYDVKFLARVSGVPKPDLSWYKNGKPIHDSDKYRIKQDGDSYCLYVKDISPDDAGKYKCIATNREGEASCEAQLQVVDKIEKTQRMEPPSFLKKIGDCEVYKGMTAKFTACATGYPEPDVEWYRGDDKLYPSERIRIEKEGTGLLRLCIVGVDPDVDIGKYRCRIFNPYGEDSCEANIVYDSLEIRPRKPIGDQYTDFEKYQSTGVPLPLSDPPIISRMTDRKLTLSWKPSIPHGPREPVTYLVEMCEQPDGEWFTARKGVRSCVCEIHNLEPFRDYKFRIRVENKYGTSDPSPFALTHRARLAPEPPKFTPHLPPGVDFHPETSPYFPKDFDIDRPPHDKYAQAPRFLRQEHDTQYGVKGHNCNLFWFVYGYPKPKMQYFFNDEPIEMGGRYDSSYTRNGQATLFINKMLDRDVGVYEAVATNEHGQARQRVRLEIAEYPQFLQRPEETVIMTRKSGRLIARVVGVPYPEIKWFKDWQPLASSSRVKIQFIEPDQCVLTINDAMTRDEGLYSISASNIAGTVSSSVMVRVEENEAEYSYMNYDKVRNVKARTKPIHDKYDLGDELGRGTQGITYHAVERSTGRNYAAKVMHGKGSLRALMRNELDIMNQLNHRKLIRLQDAYEDPTRFTLVMELAGGGELLEALTKQTFTTESEIASYIRQVLWGLEHMHDQNIAHLGLTPGDLLISHAGGDDLKICDFGLSRRIPFGKHASLEYGMPEYVSPEIVKGDGVGTPADLWALGIITHVLLTGISPFKGNNDMETLDNIKENKWSFQEDIWSKFTKEARDFITRLLTVQQEARMTIKEALKHPWLNLANKIPANEYNITTDSLRNYYNSLKDWYSNASCRKWYRQQPLSGAYTHPSHMVYPPGGIYTPEDTPERYLKDKEPKQPRTWEDQIPSREPVDYELGLAKSESHYQNGPDTYLLQLRDVDFPVRLREYMKVAANRTPTGLGFTRESLDQQPHIDWRAPVIRERRRFTDIMDEEIDDERKARINRYGSPDTYTLRRLRNEIGTRLDAHVEAEALIEAKRDGHAPFFREKPQITPIREEQNAELSCLAVGDPKPIIQWFKNDLVIGESNRIKIIEDESGRSVLRLQPALSIDAGIYKVVARNKVGQTVARTRLVMATVPGAPDSPDVSEISDTEVLLRWKLPRDDGNSPILCYNLQYKEAESVEWTDVASNIDHEFWVVRNLRPKTGHQFRLAARNNLGWSPKGIPTETIKTKEPGAPKITITSAMRHYQTLSESGLEIKPEDSPVSKTQIDYNKETSPIQWSTEQPTDKYNFISEIHRGQFSVVVKGIKKSNEEVVVGKLLEWQSDTEEQVNQEFEALRSLRHERIASLLEAFRPSGSNIAVFIEEKLQGADILTYLSSRHEYTEQMVATVITQILDALHYLHWRGFCHLNVQPDNIVMASIRSVQVKLVDLGSAQPVSKLGTVVKKTGSLEYSSPEVLSEEPAFPQSDIWSVGILAYILLSGASPFAGTNNEETRRNINFVRYRFEHLYKELTQEATRFIMLIFKRTPSKRPTAEECHEHRWLLPTEYMIKRRERAVFLGNRLKEFSDKYHSKRTEEATQWDPLSNTVVGKGPLARSNSIQEELLITF